MKVAKSAGTIFRVLLSVGLVMLGYLFIDLDINHAVKRIVALTLAMIEK